MKYFFTMKTTKFFPTLSVIAIVHLSKKQFIIKEEKFNRISNTKANLALFDLFEGVQQEIYFENFSFTTFDIIFEMARISFITFVIFFIEIVALNIYKHLFDFHQ